MAEDKSFKFAAQSNGNTELWGQTLAAVTTVYTHYLLKMKANGENGLKR